MRLAQPRALGRKVSDEFTPICRVHHREVHRTQRTAMVGAFGRRAAGYCAKLWGADPPTADAEGAEAHGGSSASAPEAAATVVGAHNDQAETNPIR